MELQNYEGTTRVLIDQVLEQKRDMSREVFGPLEQLLEEARKTGDKLLQGFAHYHIADAHFSFETGYSDFRNHLAKAVSSLSMAGEKELLARAYNLIAIDAINNGSFDVAYLYLMNALQTCEDMDDPYLLSIIHNNIGQVFGRMRSYEKGVEYVRRSNELQAQCPKEDFYYNINMINGYSAEGTMYALMGNLEKAREADRRITELEKENESAAADNSSVLIPIALLRYLVAVLEGNEALSWTRSRDFIRTLKGGYFIYDYILDIEDLCHFLIQRGYLEPVGEILEIVRETVEATNVVQMKKVVSSIEIAYYDKMGDVEKVNECLRNQYRLSVQQEMEQNKIYQHSIDLIQMMEAQRKEQEKMRQENEALQSQVQTDPLTHMPNRLMLDSLLPQLFETAQQEGKSFGVCLMDINKFKEYNDTYGHLAGDICLQKVAQAIQKTSEKPGVYCARYGGDEFIMLYMDKRDAEIRGIAEELAGEIRSQMIPHSAMGGDGLVSISQGICNGIPQSYHRQEDFINEADTALYAVKKNQDAPGRRDFIRLAHVQ